MPPLPPKDGAFYLRPPHPFLPSPPRRPPQPPPITCHPSPRPSRSLPPALVASAEIAKCGCKKTRAHRGALAACCGCSPEQPGASPSPARPTIMELHLELGALKESRGCCLAARPSIRCANPAVTTRRPRPTSCAAARTKSCTLQATGGQASRVCIHGFSGWVGAADRWLRVQSSRA